MDVRYTMTPVTSRNTDLSPAAEQLIIIVIRFNDIFIGFNQGIVIIDETPDR